jgi:predicted small integral membrane protein
VTTRIAKILLVCGIGFFYTLVVFNNLTDFGSNYQFVHHVLSMDSTLPGNHGMWRALLSTRLQLLFYLGIIAWELTNMVLLWWSVGGLVRVIGKPARVFNGAKRIAILALTLSLAMWLFAFLDVGGEWFLMWQSRTWNGQEAAFRMFAVVGIVFLILIHPDLDDQP